jgi:hypothetical protein
LSTKTAERFIASLFTASRNRAGNSDFPLQKSALNRVTQK